ncbi:MAG: YceI family protein [Actinobacteria bacterium]|nr:YceI family protein [Actinomycetota bacterium]
MTQSTRASRSRSSTHRPVQRDQRPLHGLRGNPRGRPGEEPGSARAYGVIRAASITSDQERRDAHLRSGDFFDVEKFPEIRFESTRIEPAGDGRVAVTGNLSIKDAPQEVVLRCRSARLPAPQAQGLGQDGAHARPLARRS